MLRFILHHVSRNRGPLPPMSRECLGMGIANSGAYRQLINCQATARWMSRIELGKSQDGSLVPVLRIVGRSVRKLDLTN